MLIDKAYFIGDNDIPNTDYEEVDSAVSRLISTRETEYLQLMLGITTAEEFRLGLLEDPIPAEWLALKDGAPAYISLMNGRATKWNGLVGTSLLSPIADYCYYWYLRSQVSQSAGVGEVETDNLNSTRVSSKRKQAETWNRMVEQNWILYDYLRCNQEAYPEYDYFVSGLSSKSRSLLIKINPYNF